MLVRMIKKFLSFIVLFSCCLLHANESDIYPYQIVIFRHAEKLGDSLHYHLNAQGQQRAAYLVDFLLKEKVAFNKTKPIIDQENQEIVAVFVPNPTVHGQTNDYVRPTQTIIPLFHEADYYLQGKTGNGVYLNNHHDYKEAPTLFEHILYNEKYRDYVGKTVVVCWEHGEIPSMFDQYFSDLKPYFKHLGEERYDMVWVIRWNNGVAEAHSYYQVPSSSFLNP